MQLKVAEVIIKCLESEGVEYAFGISGSHYLAFFKALKDSSIKFISVKHESAASLMAVHYVRFAQKPVLIMGTAGPGAMNLLSGVAELYKANLPCFIVTPIVPGSLQGKNSFQEDSGYGNSYSIAEVMRSITKKSITCCHPDNIAFYIRDLFRYSLHGRKGPVHLLVPTDHFEVKIDFDHVPINQYRITNEKNIDYDNVRTIARELYNSRNPLFFIGQRAWYPNISEELERISDAYCIPVIASASAKGLCNEYSPFFGGIFDLYGHRSAEVLIKQSDCIVSIGEDFGEFATNKYEKGLFDNKLIQIDIDGYDIGRNYPVKIGTYGDLSAILTAIDSEMRIYGPKRFFGDDFQLFVSKQNKGMLEEMEDDGLPLKPQRVLKEVSNLLPKGAIVISDIGACGYFSLRYLKLRRNEYSVSMSNYTMGQGVAGSLGAKLAAPDTLVMALCGDGALLMNGMEMATSRQYAIPVIWLVFANKCYGAVEWAQKLIYNDLEYCTSLYVPDLKKLADSFTIDYYMVNDIHSLRDNVSAAISNYTTLQRGAVVEVVIDPDEMLPLKPQSVKFIQDIRNLQDFNASPHLMKAFKRMLREKV